MPIGWHTMRLVVSAVVSVPVSVLACHVRSISGTARSVVASLLACHVLVVVHPSVLFHLSWRDRDGMPCPGGDPCRVVNGSGNQPFLHGSCWHAMSYRSHHFLRECAQIERLDPCYRPCYATSVFWFDSSTIELQHRPLCRATPGTDEEWSPELLSLSFSPGSID